MNPVIKVQDLNKTFHISDNPNDTIREQVFNVFSTHNKRQISALQNLNFEVHRGEIFGIIGRNGSGKSTLLKILLGAMTYDKGGKIETNGRVMRLALGMGFDGNLTARENIYVNGSIIGLALEEIDEVFDDIVIYSGLEQFIHTKLKYFSDGMRTRLSFSLALYVKTDILLIDEFFGGVGDVDFREKSTAAFHEHIVAGKTIVLVSHNLNDIIQHCQRALWLDKGRQMAYGESSEVVEKYLTSVRSHV